MDQAWLPKGYTLCEGDTVHKLLWGGEQWQIYDMREGNRILAVMPELAERWVRIGLMGASLFWIEQTKDRSLSLLRSKKQFALSPVRNGISPLCKADCLAFALALRASRAIEGVASFHDAIYVEQYARLLPTWSITPAEEDEFVLGTWLSGGVSLSARSFRRMSYFMGWLAPKHLMDVLSAAGLDIPEEELAQSEKKPQKKEAPLLSYSAQRKGNFVLIGRPSLEEFFNEHIIDIVLNSEKYKALGINFPSAVVLHGPPGCGKTYAVERLVEFLDWPIFSINSQTVGSPYIHETSRKISEVFNAAIKNAPSVLVIDEMEAYLTARSASNDSAHHRTEEVAEFLRRIPEAVNKHVLIIAMTNMIDRIDPAILRRGRFDHIVEVGMPSPEEVRALLHSLLAKVPTQDGLTLEKAVEALKGTPLSDSAFFVREAARLAARAGKSVLDQISLDEALKRVVRKSEEEIKRIGF